MNEKIYWCDVSPVVSMEATSECCFDPSLAFRINSTTTKKKDIKKKSTESSIKSIGRANSPPPSIKRTFPNFGGYSQNRNRAAFNLVPTVPIAYFKSGWGNQSPVNPRILEPLTPARYG
jgi:hypothetical protein